MPQVLDFQAVLWVMRSVLHIEICGDVPFVVKRMAGKRRLSGDDEGDENIPV